MVASMEKSFDRRLDLVGIDDPFVVLGPTRGIYLDGYGVVFTTELNLLATATLSPFRPAFTKDELLKIKQKKAERLIALKKNMREMLIAAAASLDNVPASEQVVLGVTLFYYNWEDSAGLPQQVVMKAPRKILLEAMHGANANLDSSIQITEF